VKRIFEGYNPRDLKKTLMMITKDIESKREKRIEIPPALVNTENEIRKELRFISA
jgi:hypothetical protein